MSTGDLFDAKTESPDRETAEAMVGKVYRWPRSKDYSYLPTVIRVVGVVEDSMSVMWLVFETAQADQMGVNTLSLRQAEQLLVVDPEAEREWADGLRKAQAGAKKRQQDLAFLRDAFAYGIRGGGLIAVRVTRTQIVTLDADHPTSIAERRWNRRTGQIVGGYRSLPASLRAELREYLGDREKVDIVAERKAAAVAAVQSGPKETE